MRKSIGYALRLQALVFSAVLLSLLAVCSNSRAATVSFGLSCVLDTLGAGPCAAGPTYGTVMLEDLSGADVGKVKVTVDLIPDDGSQKFRDLMLNFAGAASAISDNDSGNTVILNSNSFSISPYGGDFDIGGSGSQGWNATTTGPYSTVLSGNVAISTSDFMTLDTGGNLYAALHIQSIGNSSGGSCNGTSDPACAPGVNGDGSLKIGAPTAVNTTGGGIPEPATVCLLGAAGVALGFARRRR
jgi:hypothetical protein